MINVVGLGYIGLPTALMFASHGVEVVGTDYNKELVETLNQGKTTFEEEGLDDLFQNAVAAGIKFSSEYVSTDMYIVAVPTPYDKFSKKIDACYVVSAVKSVMEVCPKGATVVIESTVSPGTIDKFVRPVVEEKGFVIGEDINLVHAPERIIPGNMVYELEHNSRTIGADNGEIGEKVKELYSAFCKGEIVVTDIRTAEMTKVVENTYRDINIAYANELAKICRSDNMDVKDSFVEGMEVVDVREVTVTGDNVEFPLTITFKVPGVLETTKVAVLHYVDGAWKQETAKAGQGTITATFDSLSPVAFVVDKNTAASSSTSPKTGESMAVTMAAVVVVVAAAGAFAFRKKESVR